MKNSTFYIALFILIGINLGCNNQKNLPLEKLEVISKDSLQLNLSEFNLDSLQDFNVFFNTRELSGLNKYVDSNIGVTILYSIGVYPSYTRLDSFEADKNFYLDKNIPFWIVDDFTANIKQRPQLSDLQTSDELIFECEEVFQYGNFIDNGPNKNIMSSSIKQLLEISDYEDYSQDYIDILKRDLVLFQQLESKQLRIVQTWKESETGLNKIAAYHFVINHGKLCLILIDFQTFNCSV